MQPDAAVIRSTLNATGVHEAVVEESTLGIVCRVRSQDAVQSLQALRDSALDFIMLVDLFGTDTGNHVEITYHLRSFARDEDVFVKTELAYDGELASAWNLFASALLPERETAELFGLKISGHPNPKRLFTTDGTEPLLLKSVAIRTAEEVRNR